MKPRTWTSILMFISAYSPLFLIFMVRDFDFEHKHYFEHPIAIYITTAIVAASIFLLFAAVGQLKDSDMMVKITSVKNRSTDLFNYSILYVICFFAIDLDKWGDFISMCIFLVLMLLLTLTTNSVFLNPILSLAGYGLYDLDYEINGKEGSTIILTREKLVASESRKLISINPYLYLIK